MSAVKHGWFSAKSLPYLGTLLYATPDGREVAVTSISSDRASSGILYDDVEYVGPVTNYIRRLTKPGCGSHEGCGRRNIRALD